MPGTIFLDQTGNALIDGTLAGVKWDATILTFGFPALASQYPAGYAYGGVEPNFGFASLSAEAKGVVRVVFASYQAVSGITFSENLAAPGDADIRLAISAAADPTAYAYYPDSIEPTGSGGDVWFGTSYDYGAAVSANYTYLTVLHEIGHALGLKHGHESGFNDIFGAFPILPLQYDSMEYSVMTYRSYTGANVAGGYTNEDFGYAQSLMIADIAGIQEMYGANFSTNSTDTVYTFSSTTGQMFINGVGQDAPGANRVFRTIWDGGGVDTYDFSNYTDDESIDLTPGGNSLFSSIQRANLDVFDATPIFAHGNVYNALEYHGDIRSLIENAIGGLGNDTITGNDAGNVLTGNAGNDNLGGGNGNDTLIGGLGNDVVDGGTGVDTASYLLASGSIIAELTNLNAGHTGGSSSGADGNDTLADIENIIGSAFNDTLTGNNQANVLTGGAGNDRLFGGTGNDILNGDGDDDILNGMTGNDVMSGGAGNDRFYVFDAGDQVFETQTGGTADRVYAALNYTLAASQYVEFLHAYGAAATGAGVMLGGNELANTIYGGAGNDTLNGGGGNDKLYGQTGNDTLDGGDGADLLQGEDGNDRLIGGLGMDNLFGGAGSDVFVLQPLNANRDTIRDYFATDDQLEISAALFGASLVAGQPLSATRFLSNTTGIATLANGGSTDTRFIYNSSNGVLYFDADGTGSGGRIHIATLQNAGAAAAGLTAADFNIV